jgi:hypothetical protein
MLPKGILLLLGKVRQRRRFHPRWIERQFLVGLRKRIGIIIRDMIMMLIDNLFFGSFELVFDYEVNL